MLETWEIMEGQYYHISCLGDTVFLNGQPTDDPRILEMAGRMMTLEQFDMVEATFQPRNLKTLKPKAKPWIGWRGRWQADWIIEEGEHKGMWAMGVISDNPRPPFAWTTLMDLTDVVRV